MALKGREANSWVSVQPGSRLIHKLALSEARGGASEECPLRVQRIRSRVEHTLCGVWAGSVDCRAAKLMGGSQSCCIYMSLSAHCALCRCRVFLKVPLVTLIEVILRQILLRSPDLKIFHLAEPSVIQLYATQVSLCPEAELLR